MRVLLSILLVTALTACSQTYYQEMQTSADEMSALKTFSWENTASLGNKNQDIFDKAFRESLSAHLQNKGYEEVASEPQLTVDYRISILPQEAVPAGDASHGVGWRLGDNGEPIYEGWNNPTGVSDIYQRGLIILTVSRASDNAIVWQAGTARVVNEETADKNKLKTLASRFARHLASKLPKAK